MVSENNETVNLKGSSYFLPAHGCGGARARKNLSAAKKSFRTREDGSAGGFKGGMPSRPSANPAACSFRAEPSKILFSLIEKNFLGRAQIKKCKEYFARRRASASGGGAGQFASKKVRAKDIISPPVRKMQIGRSKLAARDAPLA